MRFSAWCMVSLSGCASAHATAERPQSLDISPAQTPTPAPDGALAIDASSDQGGDADFRAVANRAMAADGPAARSALEGFLVHHPHHHQRPAAVVMLAGVLLGLGDATAAKTLLDENASQLATLERDFLMGLCESRLGNYARALGLLGPYVQADPPRFPGFSDALSRSLLRIALADALAVAGDPAGAMDQLELYAQIEGGRDTERAYALARAAAIASKVADAAALNALTVRRSVLTRATLGTKAAAALRARGDEANAVKLDQETLAVRRQLGLEAALPSAVPADPTRLGLVVPLSGAQGRLGEVVLRGAMLVVTAASHGGETAAFHLQLRDAAAGPERSALGGGTLAGILSLAREEKVVGVVSTPDARAIDMAARDGIPLLLLDERSPGAQSTAFPLIHPTETRAIALARKALALGARRFAILGPDSTSGKRIAAAYKKAVEDGGGTVTGHITYAVGATSFSAAVASLRKLPFEALFVPDDASRLELVAPALAVADIWPRSPRTAFTAAHASGSSGQGRREALLLSTALSVSPKFLHNTERYVQGALLCPGFYPADDARSGSFVARFREAYGSSPSATDAYGYDAVFLLRGAVERGARSRADVLRILSTQTFEGLTGDIHFGPDHSRIDPPLVYVVDGDSIHVLK
jgi:ABC-type branched-subunit amino acid transport system substrate-binding protein